MAKKPKYYAIRVGRKTGIETTWEACQESIKGYSGAVYRSFCDEQAALDWLDGEKVTLIVGESKIEPQDSEQFVDYDVYTDGSYSNGNYAWAYVFVKNDQIIYEDKGIGKNPEAAAMRNVAGEIAAVLQALKRAAEMKARIRINHDYAGIAFWVNGEWRTKTKYTELYVKLMKQYEGIYIFQKVQAHSGDKYNNYVDRLAKDALGIV
ncbi:MAG: ribonuclease H family protein [Desulfitobacteriaceae bacterium]|nr:ribonuclease H family protein [Desulfitobacteriaceae bacterium]MDD4347410.1 ribonuclease H family protein [Desulfitobacteriaceae bacterium]MDD4401196.1 ribonuclease H family protein [Desulfitobacteriaceae bacterium]